jgi:putative MATE family efflux protein
MKYNGNRGLIMTDLTKGRPFSHILRLSLPLFFCVLFQQSGLIHSFAAGKYLGEEALSVIGNVTSLTEIFMIFAYGMNVGGSVVVSHLYGAGKKAEQNLAITTLFITGTGFAAVITAIGFLFSDAVLLLINTPTEIFTDSQKFLHIFLLGLVFMYIFNIASGIFTALGDSITPAVFLIVSNAVNLALDILSARNTALGVSGLAWAGLVSQVIAAAAAVLFLVIKLKKQRITEKSPLFTFSCFRSLMKNIVPAMLHSSVSAIGNLLIQGIINPMGTAAIAGCALGGKVNGFASSCIDSVPDGNSAYAAQNIGAGKLSRVKEGFHAGLIIVLILSGFFTAAVLIFHNAIINLFMEENTSAEAVNIAVYYIISASFVYPLMGVKYLCDDLLRAAGRMKLYLLTTVINLSIRVVSVFIFASKFGVAAVYIGFCLSLVLSTAVSIIIYRKNLWRKKLVS